MTPAWGGSPRPTGCRLDRATPTFRPTPMCTTGRPCSSTLADSSASCEAAFNGTGDDNIYEMEAYAVGRSCELGRNSK